MAKWLTENLDRMPFYYNKEVLNPILKDLDDKKAEIVSYSTSHPEFYNQHILNNKKRQLESALSFLGFEDHAVIDAVPTTQKTPIEKEIEEDNIKKVEAYSKASEYIHRCALNTEVGMENCGLEAEMLIKSHSILCSYSTDAARLKSRPRFRNENDGLIIVGGGVFNPVEGDLVKDRMERLFTLYNIDWYNDPALIKGTKFLIEYIRIQQHLDGNKRVALMALNFVLERNGYPCIYLHNQQYDKFIQELHNSILQRDITPLCLLFTQNIQSRQNAIIHNIVLYRTQKKLEKLEEENSKNNTTIINKQVDTQDFLNELEF